MHDVTEQTRRAFLSQGIGAIAASQLLGRAPTGNQGPGQAPRGRRHAPRAKRVIHLYMAGGPSHLETLEEKPALAALDGQPMPESFTRGQPIAQLQGQRLVCLGPRFPFASFGQSGQRICARFPHIGSVADEIAIIRSMQTDQINHDPAHTLFNTGNTNPGRPSMGSWINYGIGSECDDLPGFVVLSSVGRGGQAQPIAARQWSAGFLPSRFQGVEFRSKGDPVLFLADPDGVDRAARRRVIDGVSHLNAMHLEDFGDPETATRIEQYELAFRMQASVPELMDIGAEPAEVHELYGTQPGKTSFANHCLLARRLVERGVRFVQLFDEGWDHHGSVFANLPGKCRQVDRPIAALLHDLRRRGLLDDTLVVWASEFGRTPMAQTDNGEGKKTKAGRDHHMEAYSMWMAGGGVRGGTVFGQTDELGYAAAENPVHVHDVNATILHLLGIDHERLTFRFQGRDHRLTDVAGNVIGGILA